MHNLMPRTLVFASCLSLLALGCSSTAPSGDQPEDERLETPDEPSALDEVHQLLEEADEHFTDRSDVGDIRRALQLWDEALEHPGAEDLSDEHRTDIHVSVARAHYLVARYWEADGPVPDDDAEPGDEIRKGLAAAERAVRLTAPEFADAVDAGAPFEAELPGAPPEATEPLLWYGKHLDLRARTGDESTRVAQRPVVDAVMEHVSDHRPELHHGAAHRYFGVRGVDRLLHVDPEASEAAFEASLEVAPDYLTTRLLKARHLDVTRGDRQAFETRLREVVDAPEDRPDETDPEQRIVREWAADLLEDIDTFFDTTDPEATR